MRRTLGESRVGIEWIFLDLRIPEVTNLVAARHVLHIIHLSCYRPTRAEYESKVLLVLSQHGDPINPTPPSRS